MRVLPYFNNIQLPVRSQRTAGVKPAEAGEPHKPLETKTRPVSSGDAPGTDVFIPSSPVSGVVYSYKAPPAGNQVPDTIIKSGSYSFYQLNGSLQKSRDAGNVGEKLDLKG